MSMRLYELIPAYNELEHMLDDPTVDEIQVQAWLEACGGELRAKVTDIAMLVRNLEETADSIERAEMKMSDRRKAIENRVKSIKDYMLRCMKAAGITKIECEFFNIGISNNPPKIVVDDENAIPIAYWRQAEPPPPAIDKKAILEDIKQGVIVDGAHMEQGQRLMIK